MTTKQKAIQEAYGEYWENVKYFVDQNGFIWQSTLFFPETEMKDKFEVEVKGFPPEGRCKWRPISLQGIENNNGWIKIESEEDLPKEGYVFWIIRKGINFPMYRYVDHFSKQEKNDWMKSYTHYQPITKPKPPIY